MGEILNVIFNGARIKEEAAFRMYKELEQKALNPLMKLLFAKLADEELIHKRLFEKDINILKVVNSSKLSELNLLKDIDKTEISLKTVEDINHALDFAIKEEEKAHHDYNFILNHIDFGKERDTYEMIAKQELRHKLMLEKVRLEFNGKEWDVL